MSFSILTLIGEITDNKLHREKQTLIEAFNRTEFYSASCNVLIVTEGEASLHFLMNLENNVLQLKDGSLLTVCDAGGSTIDTTLYKCVSARDLTFEEVGSADCLQKGGMFDPAIGSILSHVLVFVRSVCLKSFESKSGRIACADNQIQ